MKLFIDIGHPGHVHYFKNLIRILTLKGHEVFVSARERDVIFKLLESNNIDYFNRGKGKDSRIGKFLYMINADFDLFNQAKDFKPDVFISFSSPYAAQVSKLLGKPHIAFNDTEHTDKTHSIFTYPFSTNILTPKSYQNSLGHKHIRFDNIIEGMYLHQNYYSPDPSIYSYLGISKSERYIILRFVSWQAHHDYGQSGLDKKTIVGLINILKTRYRIFISSERELDLELERYKLQIPPEKMHDVLFYADLFIGESGTMASESAYLGTNAVYINSLPLMCYLKQEQESGLLKHFNSSIGVVEYVFELVKNKGLKKEAMEKAELMKKNFIDPTAFLVWFIENYPESAKIMKEKPDYQYNFK